MTFHYLHTSGHAYVETLKKVVDTIKPQCVIPIYTFEPDKYGMLGCPLKRLDDGEAFEL